MAQEHPRTICAEIVDAANILMTKSPTTLKEIMKLVPGSGFTTGAYHRGREGIEALTKRGPRQLTMSRQKPAIEDPKDSDKHPHHGNPLLR